MSQIDALAKQLDKAYAEIARLQRERDQIELDLIQSRAVLDQLRKLFAHIEGINDERDSVPILLEARRILGEGK